MRYLISVLDDRSESATADEMAAVDQFNERLRAEGHWIMATGLASPDQGLVIEHRGGTELRSGGLFFESGDYVSGFWIVEVPTHETALELASEGSRHCGRKVELRPFLEV